MGIPPGESGSIGVGISNGLGFGSSEYVVFRPSKLVEKDWLYYFLSRAAFREEGAKRMSGAVGHKRVSKEFIESHLIPLPPRAEQKRIIAILDEAFEGIDTALANAEKNLASARELFDCQVSSIFINRGIGWQDRKLDQVCIVERGSSPRPIQDYFTTEINGVNWIKIGDTEEGGKYVYKTAQKITPEGAKKSRRVDEGDFILTNSMSFGRPYIMKTSGYIHDGWFVLRLNDTIDSEYFYYLLSSSFVQSQFAQLASGSVVKNISGDLVKKAVLPIPPLAQQQVIVSQLLKASSETTRLEAIYQQKVSSLERLRQAILQKAFAGKLTARSANALPQAAE
jgi:type I restriction enzyme S subunit